MNKNNAAAGTPAAPQKSSSFKKSFSTRQFKSGGFATLLIAVALALTVIVNLLVNQLPATVKGLDLTDKKLYSIGDQTKTLVSSLENPVTVYWIVSTGSEDTVLEEMLDRYKALSDNLTIKKVDPVLYPKFTSTYTTDSVAENSLIVVCGDRSKVVPYSTIVVQSYNVTDYSTGAYDVTSSFDGESALTGAIDYVTTDHLPTAYYLTGHGEPGLASDLNTLLGKQNIAVQQLSLLNADAIPDDCSALIIDSPTVDLYENEATMILEYLQGGGKLVLLTNYTGTEMPNLASITDAYHVYRQSGVVLDNDRNYYYQSPIYNLPKICSHTITQDFADQKLYILYPMTQSLAQDETLPDTETVTPLLQSSSDAFLKQDMNDNSSTAGAGDITEGAPYSLAVCIENKIDDDATTQIVWYASGYLLDTQFNQAVSGNNYNLFVNTLGYACGHENAIAIESKDITAAKLVVTDAAAGFWSTLYTILLPLAVLGCGIVVFVKRRAKK